MTPPDHLDTTDLEALQRSIARVRLCLKALMVLSMVFGRVPDWKWWPFRKLLPQIAAI